MCASLTKIGLPTSAHLDNRRLALDVAALLVRWEQQRLSGPPSQPEVRPNLDPCMSQSACIGCLAHVTALQSWQCIMGVNKCNASNPVSMHHRQ